MRSQPALASAIEDAIVLLAGVTAATANPVSGTVVVTCEDDADLDALRQVLHAQIDTYERPMSSANDAARGALARVLHVALPERRELALPVALSVTAQSLNVLQNLAIFTSLTVAGGGSSKILRRLGVTKSRTQLKVITGASLGLTLGEVWTQHRRAGAWRRTSLNAEHRLRLTVFSHIQAQDLTFFDKHGTGLLLNTLTEQVESIGALISGIDGLLEAGVVVAVAATALVRTSPRLGLIAAVALPVAVLPGRLLGDRASRAFSKVGEPAGNLTQGLENILTGIVEVKSFTAERREQRRITSLSEQVATSSEMASAAARLQVTVLRNVLYLTATTMFASAAQRVIDARVSLAKLTQSAYWIPQLMAAIGRVVQSSAIYYGAAAAAQRLAAILDSSPRIQSGPIRLPSATVRGEIAVENLTFGYDAQRPVLRDISFRLPAGSTLGIVGPTGSGKSTLLRLLLRFYDPDAGRILIDGHDVQDLDLSDLRSAIALVSQDVYLFDATMSANLRYGKSDATEEEISTALAASAADDILVALPDGLNAQLGERGRLLSGGQRQRLALARALLKDSPILALDEATSHLDYASEAAIKASLKTAASRKTVILIAHRLSSVRDADNIIVLDHGAIREQGSHQSLLDQQGLYHHLWTLQS